MKYLLIFLFSAFVCNATAQTIINDANAEVRNVGAFSGIKAWGGIDIYLSQSDEYALAVSASDAKYRNGIKTEITNGILNIYYDGGSIQLFLNDNRRLRVYISFKTLESLESSGACDFIINGIYKANSVRIKLSGASEIKGTLEANDVQLNLSGASTLKLSGRVNNLIIDASGASDVKSYDLAVDNCIAEISGASDIRLTVNKSITAKASGASTLYYKGNPDKKDVSSSGASNVSQRN